MDAAEQLRLTARMRSEWNDRARKNARFYINNASAEWTDEEFFRTGEENVEEHILTDMQNICQGMAPPEMNVLEIGCGAGRLTRALARVFGAVHAVDVSSEMIRIARDKLEGVPNVHLYCNNGVDLSVLPHGARFDFAFSFIVFQHVPSLDVIASYCRDVGRCLRPGGLFKFQVQGYTKLDTADTWLGTGVSEADARKMAEDYGFELRYSHGAGTQFYWLWFFKREDCAPDS
jgi:SAM-dependent methyltransferase